MKVSCIDVYESNFAVLQEESDPLPRCNMCVMHMPEGELVKHQRTACCFVSSRCAEIEFGLTVN